MRKWYRLGAILVLTAFLLSGCEWAVVTETEFEIEGTTIRTQTGDATLAPSNTPTGGAGGNSTHGGGTTNTPLPPSGGPTVHTLTPIQNTAYYGLSQLPKLPNGAKLTETYTKIAAASENLQTEIALDGSLTQDEVFLAFCYYRADYPQHFWCGGNIGYRLQNDKVVQLTLTFTMSKEAISAARKVFDQKVTDILKIAATGANEYERERLIHDELARRVTYQGGTYAHDAYGALVQGKAVCEGYARAFQYLLYQAGIPCLMVEGSGINPQSGVSEPHAWNVVRIDGQYYHVDVTWDDVDRSDLAVMYAFFNVTTAEISSDHTASAEQCYAPPLCQATAANYHVKNDTRLTAFDASRIADKLSANPNGVHFYSTQGGDAFMTWIQENHRALASLLRYNGYTYRMVSVGKEVFLYMAQS